MQNLHLSERNKYKIFHNNKEMSVKNWDIYSKAGLPTTNFWVIFEVALVFLTVYGNQSKNLRTVGYDFEMASPYSYAMKIFQLLGC